MIHLDTSFLIGALDQGSPQDRSLRRWVGGGETLTMSAVACANEADFRRFENAGLNLAG